jgi:hypothetical protein
MEKGEQLAGEGILDPLLKALEGEAVPRSDMVQASRLVAAALVRNGCPITVSGEGPWAGVWDQERLTDGP